MIVLKKIKLGLIVLLLGIVLSGCQQLNPSIEQQISGDFDTFFDETKNKEYEIFSSKNLLTLDSYNKYLVATGIRYKRIDSYYDEEQNIVWSMYTGDSIKDDREIILYFKSTIENDQITSITKYRYLFKNLESETR